MGKTDKEVLELCKAWFEDIMERSDRLTTGNVAHGRAAIHGVAKNYAEFVAEHLEERWKPSDEQIDALEHFVRSIGESGYASPYDNNTKLLYSLLEQLKKLKGE